MPRYQEIARQLKTAIEQGELKPGARLPSSRTWSQELGVSRSTVENAYAELVAQGWLVRRGQAGTFVSEQIHPQKSSSDVVVFAGESEQPLPFQMGLPALDLFPRELWARVMGRRLRTQTRFNLALGDVCGEAALREAIVDYLRVSRGIESQPEQVFITHGYAASMSLILRALAEPGDGMWMEDPGFPLIRPIVTRHGVNVFPVPVDDNGLDVTSGIQNYPDARFALITPAHQSPQGVALSLARRHQVLEWAERSQAWVIEDDYDSEFRYHGKPLPALKSLDAPQRVIYAGTFSKSLFPALRCAWLVVPVEQIAQFRQQASLEPCAVPVLWQNTLADFIRDGHFWRHLKKMRQHYAQRRQWIEQALTQQGFQVVPQKGGIQMVISMMGDDIAYARKANAAGLAVQALSTWRIRSTGKGGLLLSFTNIVSESMAQQVAQQLRDALS
ncbi:PLP-dependent aminotransferase family protein [Escherichia marmotae]|uniref:MocR-like pyridoxine biosynthesis transcription factor PdxR n=1 Tax=Escherichia TaxID=561 RepID=UPI000CF7AD79|nr:MULTISPECIES: PLP-dependent aminotransferase family protein [Escherichia]EFN9757396.1 PLP-dependent aminotransferase family protein [Escherichia coli]EFO1630733.1 PLP-dependent aminotransferase family protein [Escherichia coli]MBB2417159.1 PLP-dependent aminotransferase family protein [Escherichia sp. 11.1596]MBB2421643.1 PLP-dependent aminotransferase family protein [Escherichia sp. 12.2610]MBB2426147.1 PLP-dependent aminotransferase family protein [Escherichia sp. 11.1597]